MSGNNRVKPAGGSPSIVKAKRSAQAGRAPFQIIARTGYLARGLVYAIVGLAALSVAAGTRKNAINLSDALRELFQRPLGIIVKVGERS
jgi:hypothetical protein